MYTIVLDNIYSTIIGNEKLPDIILEALDKQLSYYVQDSFFIAKNLAKNEDENENGTKKNFYKCEDYIN